MGSCWPGCPGPEPPAPYGYRTESAPPEQGGGGTWRGRRGRSPQDLLDGVELGADRWSHMGKLIIFFIFFSWAFVSLQELNLCINYTSELNEGAGVPQTAFAFIRKHGTHIWLCRETAAKVSFWGDWRGLGGADPSGQCRQVGGGGPRWRRFGPGFHSALGNRLMTLAHLPAAPTEGRQPHTPPPHPRTPAAQLPQPQPCVGSLSDRDCVWRCRAALSRCLSVVAQCEAVNLLIEAGASGREPSPSGPPPVSHTCKDGPQAGEWRVAGFLSWSLDSVVSGRLGVRAQSVPSLQGPRRWREESCNFCSQIMRPQDPLTPISRPPVLSQGLGPAP